LCCAAWPSLASAAPNRAAADGERYLAIYLPGVYFSQLERKYELGSELASYLGERLGPSYRLTPRVYATAEALVADSSRIALGLVESPWVAEHLSSFPPVSVAVEAGSSETRLAIYSNPSIKGLADLRSNRLAHASSIDRPQGFIDNFVFESELPLPADRVVATRDVASALSLVSLKKAEAVLLYEDDEAVAQKAGLRLLYRTSALPRPTVVSFDRSLPAAEFLRLREALNQFRGHSQQGLHAFRPASESPYQLLRLRFDRRTRRLPLLVELVEDAAPLPLPRPASGGASVVPLSTYAPTIDP
jgi:hypothetical protein